MGPRLENVLTTYFKIQKRARNNLAGLSLVTKQKSFHLPPPFVPSLTLQLPRLCGIMKGPNKLSFQTIGTIICFLNSVVLGVWKKGRGRQVRIESSQRERVRGNAFEPDIVQLPKSKELELLNRYGQ